MGFLSVPNEDSLKELIEKCHTLGLKVSVFTEPDINHQITAIAIQPCDEAKKIVSNIPRAMRDLDNSKVLINKHSYNENNIGIR